jgi:hypothetical protein
VIDLSCQLLALVALPTGKAAEIAKKHNLQNTWISRVIVSVFSTAFFHIFED